MIPETVVYVSRLELVEHLRELTGLRVGDELQVLDAAGESCWLTATAVARLMWPSDGTPTPEAGEHVERGGDLLVAAALPRGCNRHEDCRAADERWLSSHLAELHVPPSYHCRDEGCEECFGY